MTGTSQDTTSPFDPPLTEKDIRSALFLKEGKGMTIKTLLEGINNYLQSIHQQCPYNGQPSPITYTHVDYDWWTPGTSLEAMVADSLAHDKAMELGAKSENYFSCCGPNNAFTDKNHLLTQDDVLEILKNLETKKGFKTLSPTYQGTANNPFSLGFDLRKAAEKYPAPETETSMKFTKSIHSRSTETGSDRGSSPSSGWSRC